MKKAKILLVLMLCALVTPLLSVIRADALEMPEPSAYAALLIDTKSGKILFKNNEQARVYPASTTKIMTILLAVEAIENGRATSEDMVTASENVKFGMDADSSSAGLVPGEAMSLRNLMYCAMVNSANDACNVIAEYIGGSIEGFVGMMNERAAQLHCSGTNFTNPHGMPDENHYTTVYDLYLIARQAIDYALFNEICNTSYIEVPETNKAAARVYSTTNLLITKNSSYYYEYASGIKTGHTTAAGYCLVSAAEKGDISLMAICIGSGETTENGVKIGLSFSDVKRLFEWGFENFSYREVIRPTEIVGEAPILIGSEESVVSVRPENAISVLLANDDDMKEFQQEITFYSERDGKPLSAPVMIGEVLGEIVLLYGGEPYASAKLVAAASVELPKLTFLKSSILAAWRSDPVQTVFWIVIIAAAVYIILVMRYKILRIRHRQNVRRARLARESGVLGTQGGAVGTTGGQAYSPEPEKNREYYQDSDETDVFKEIDSFTPLQSANGDPEENPEADLDFFENFFNKKQ